MSDLVKLRRFRLPLLLVILVVVASVALLFTPVTVYGGSMKPTLGAGELLLTTPLWLNPPDRLDLVVFEEPDNGVRAVKRVVGLPGESVQLLQGDLLVNGELARRAVRDATGLIPLVDARGAELASAFQTELETNLIEERNGRWILEHGTVPLRRLPYDGYLEGGVLQGGVLPASDLGIQVDFVFEQPSATLELRLRTGDTITYLLELHATGGAVRYRLLRSVRGAGHDGEVLVELSRVEGVPSGSLFLAKIDRHVVASRDGHWLFDPVPMRESRKAAERGGDWLGVLPEQASFGGGPGVLIARVRIGRDFYWGPPGRFGSAMPEPLADDEYFLLGDNPAGSRDSRHYGPVPRMLLHGTVVGAHEPGASRH